MKSKEDGADLELLSTPTKEDVTQAPVDKIATKSSGSKFRKGHRRAWSMPNANRDKAVLVVADDAVKVIIIFNSLIIVIFLIHLSKFINLG